MKLGLGLGIGGSGNSLPRYVTDFANGFELPGSTYSGGPTVVADNTGTLVTSPAGVLPIEGMRLTDGVWYPTNSSGDPIHASTPLRTTKGTVSKYAETYKGPLIEPARTNKVTCRKANPVDTTNITKGGDAAAVLSVVDDSAALAAAGLDKICTSGKVYKLDNSAGSTVADAYLGGVAGANLEQFGTYIRGGSGILSLTGWGPVTFAANAAYRRVGGGVTQSGTQLRVRVDAGRIVYFILPQLEEGAFLTSPICKDSTGADPLTSLTRPAANLTRPTAGTALAVGNNFAIYGRVIPEAAGQAAKLATTYNDLGNRLDVETTSTNVAATKVITGVSTQVSTAYAHAANTPFEYLLYQHSVHGMGIAVRSWNGSVWSAWSAWATNADTQNAPIASTYQIGARDNANHFAANYPFTEIIRLIPNLHPQTQLADLLDKGRI